MITATKPVLNGSSIELLWSIPTSSVSLQLQRSYNDGTFSIVSTNIPASASTFSQSGLSDGTYVYKLFASYAYSITSNAGTALAVIIDTTAPTKPSDFLATQLETITHLTWITSNDTVGVTVRESTSRYPSSVVDGTAVLTDSPVTSHTITDLTEGLHYFSIFAKDRFGNSSLATTTSVLVDLKPTLEKLISRSEIKKGQVDITSNVTTAIVDQEIGKNASSATLNIAALYNSAGTKIGIGAGAIGHILIASENATWKDSGTVKIGSDGGAGVVEQSKGSVDISGTLQIGSDSGSTGQYILSGGTLKTSVLEIGASGGTGTFQWTGGNLQLNGVLGNLSNQGGTLQINSDSPITITGNYTQSNTGSISFTLKGTNGSLVRSTDSLSDATPLLKTTGEINLEGTISLSISGYTAKPGDTLYLVNRSNSSSLRLTGLHVLSEVNFDLPALDSRMSWDTTAFETEGTIKVVGSSSDLLVNRPLNYPNPFKFLTGTDIGYWLNADASVDFRVYTSSGSEVFRKQLSSGIDSGAKSGYNKVHFSKDEVGNDLPSGVYPYVLISSGKIIGTGRMVIRPSTF
jgi:hypothetical protein